MHNLRDTGSFFHFLNRELPSEVLCHYKNHESIRYALQDCWHKQNEHSKQNKQIPRYKEVKEQYVECQ